MESALAQIGSLPQKDKTQAYIALLHQTLASPSSLLSQLSDYLDAILSDSLAQIVARPALSEYVAKLSEIEREKRKEIMGMSLVKMQNRTTSFEEQICLLREGYATLLEEDEEFPEAAKVLIGIPLESGSRSTEYKLKVYIRIVRLFLEEEDSTSADTYFNRASLLYHTTTDLETQLQFRLCQARMFDYSRRFAEAASKYHELSYVTSLDEGDRNAALSQGITCAVLAPAGPTRSRILSSLYRDERAASSEHYTILSKMFLDQMIRPAEVASFAANLQTHQLAKLAAPTAVVADPDGPTERGKKGPETVLDRAVMEHNILACSRIYNNITFQGLGLLLDLQASAAEAMARTMIQQGRLKASLDQIETLIIFDADSKTGDGVISNVAVQADDDDKEDEASAPATKRWDQQIRQTLQMAESIAARCQILLEGEQIDIPLALMA